MAAVHLARFPQQIIICWKLRNSRRTCKRTVEMILDARQYVDYKMLKKAGLQTLWQVCTCLHGVRNLLEKRGAEA